MNVALFLIILLANLALFGVAVWVGWRYYLSRRSAVLHGELRPEEPGEAARGDILLEAQVGPAESAGVFSWPARKLDRLAEAAGVEWNGYAVLAVMAGLGLAGGTVGYYYPLLIFTGVSIAGLALAAAMLPYMVLSYRRTKRIEELESQLPEMLDFIARAVRAGHAFSVSLEMLSSEAPEPARSEFSRVFHEHNLGASLDNALRNFAARVPLVDVKFFVSAVLLQRETGGNLGEMLSHLSFTIRERFRLKGQVKAASAHGRITALVLTLLPIIVLAVLTFKSPGHVKVFREEPAGRWMAFAAIACQLTGYVLIRKVVNIKV
jgi:tight adherence protein B